jgi:hypothetical protein
MKLGKFDCSTGLINILYNDQLKNISQLASEYFDDLFLKIKFLLSSNKDS